MNYRSYLSLKLNKWINNDNLLLGYFAYWFFLPPRTTKRAHGLRIKFMGGVGWWTGAPEARFMQQHGRGGDELHGGSVYE